MCSQLVGQDRARVGRCRGKQLLLVKERQESRKTLAGVCLCGLGNEGGLFRRAAGDQQWTPGENPRVSVRATSLGLGSPEATPGAVGRGEASAPRELLRWPSDSGEALQNVLLGLAQGGGGGGADAGPGDGDLGAILGQSSNSPRSGLRMSKLGSGRRSICNRETISFTTDGCKNSFFLRSGASNNAQVLGSLPGGLFALPSGAC